MWAKNANLCRQIGYFNPIFKLSYTFCRNGKKVKLEGFAKKLAIFWPVLKSAKSSY